MNDAGRARGQLLLRATSAAPGALIASGFRCIPPRRPRSSMAAACVGRWLPPWACGLAASASRLSSCPSSRLAVGVRGRSSRSARSPALGAVSFRGATVEIVSDTNASRARLRGRTEHRVRRVCQRFLQCMMRNAQCRKPIGCFSSFFASAFCILHLHSEFSERGDGSLGSGIWVWGPAARAIA